MFIALYRCREFYSKFYGLFHICSPRWGLVIHLLYCIARDTGPGWEVVLCSSPPPTRPMVAGVSPLVFTYICWWHQPNSLTAKGFVLHHSMELLYMQSNVYLSQPRKE